MNVAIYHNLPTGGAKRSLEEWLKWLKIDNEIDIYLPNSSKGFDENLETINNVFDFNFKGNHKHGIINKIISIIYLEFLCKKIANIINKKKYDLVFVLQCQITNSPAILRHLKFPTIYFCQEPVTRIQEPHYSANSNFQRSNLLLSFLKTIFVGYDSYNASFSKKILCNSYYSKEAIYKAYNKNASLVYLGVDEIKFRFIKSIPKDLDYVLSVGHLTAAKGHDFIIKSLGLINSKIRPKLEIIYSGETPKYKKYLYVLAKKNNVRVKFSKSVSDEELIGKYNNSYLTLCAARLEPFGLTPLESMACGTLVLAVAEAGFRESIINESTGILCERDEKKFANKIEAILIGRVNYQSIVNHARRVIAKNWTWKLSAKHISNQMESIREFH